MTGRNESAPGPATRDPRAITPTQRESLWHTQIRAIKHLSPGASRLHRILTQAAEAGTLASVADLARTLGASERTIRLWLRELDAPRTRAAAAATPTPPTSASPTSTRLPGGPRDAP